MFEKIKGQGIKRRKKRTSMQYLFYLKSGVFQHRQERIIAVMPMAGEKIRRIKYFT